MHVMDAREPRTIIAIDLLRFACAAMVMTFHFTTGYPLAASSHVRALDPYIALPVAGAAWGWWGWVGLELFFVISGFVIAASARRASRGNFVRRRVLRLAPAAWVCASLTAIMLMASGTHTPGQVLPLWLASVLFVPGAPQVDQSYWTIAVEVIFYGLVATRLRSGTDNMRWIATLGWILAGLSAAYWTCALASGIDADAAVQTPLRLMLMPHGAFFALGIALWMIRDEGLTRARLALAVIAGATGLVEIGSHAAMMRGMPGIDGLTIVPMIAFALGIAVIAGAGALQRPLDRLVGVKTAMVLGLATYPLYLLHQVIGAGLIVRMVHGGVPAGAAMVGAAAIIVVMAFAVSRGAEPVVRARLAEGIAWAISLLRGPSPNRRPTAFP